MPASAAGTVGSGRSATPRTQVPLEVERLQDFFGSVVPDGDEPYDHRAYPCYDEHWLAVDPVHPERAALTERMRELGLFQIAKAGDHHAGDHVSDSCWARQRLSCLDALVDQRVTPSRRLAHHALRGCGPRRVGSTAPWMTAA